MLSTLTQTEIQDILDHVMCDVTHQIGRFPLQKQDRALSGDICTVHTTFEGGYQGRLTLCAESGLLIRLTRLFLQEESVSPQDVEDFTKEYLNIISGQMVAKLFQATHVPSRFRIPTFCLGCHRPDGVGEKPCVLSYINSCNESAQLFHQLSSNTHAS